MHCEMCKKLKPNLISNEFLFWLVQITYHMELYCINRLFYGHSQQKYFTDILVKVQLRRSMIQYKTVNYSIKIIWMNSECSPLLLYHILYHYFYLKNIIEI